MTEEKFTLFWHGPFSQWFKSSFKIDGKAYVSAEQYMMAEKARVFQDKDSERKIMKTNSPREAKALGRKVNNFDITLWESVARDIVYCGNMAKFKQNPDLLKKLLETDGTTLVEASPYDRIWGIGLSEKDPKAFDRKTWKGRNWLGEVLTKVREDIKAKRESLTKDFNWNS